jgi:hypothetical protein
MKPFRLRLFCCAALLSASLLTGCATTQSHDSASQQILIEPRADHSEADAWWTMLEWPIYIGSQALANTHN